MRRTKEDAEKTRQDLLDTALAMFSRQGYASTRLADIADAAKVTRGAIYHHFDNKAGLFMTLIAEAKDQGGILVQEAIQQGGSFVEIIKRIIIMSFELLETNRRFCQIFALQLYELGIDPELAEFQKMRSKSAIESVSSLAGFFQYGIENGELQADLDPEQAARVLLALQNGIAHLWLSNPVAFSIKKKAAVFANIFVNGIL